ncbi:nucleoside-specific channel-forming Tsx family protein [Tannerella forsythia]|uniref:DUF5020 family protein n=1 Tax=Tannerella forsythia TaxID=28112 RepID=A0A3P1XNQ1_TANFO|nr:DUF5020 family protein [Tannerella forsythia]RRD60424.1 DUF5020 family protein [Tannerella forsythia]
MKTIIKHGLLGAALLLCGALQAQNVQVHYDFGRATNDKLGSRPLWTTTVEMFKPDKWGSTFFFVDMDYKSDGVASAYWEISRELKFWKGPLSAHLEYNGGLPFVKNAYLAGPTYSYNNAQFTRGFTLSALYKYIQKANEPNNFQLTATWYLHFADGKCSFMGFADWWREPSAVGDFVFLSEPQFWVNLNRFKGVDEKFNLSLGSEVEVSYDFAGRDGLFVIPTLAMKWSF